MADGVKHWKPAPADEDWKVAICQRDAVRAQGVLDDLVDILTPAGDDHKNRIALLQGMTGDQIVLGLRAYRQKCIDSVEMGPFAGQTNWETF